MGYRVDNLAVAGDWTMTDHLAAREEPQKDQLQVVVDFLDAWRYCPVASADSPSRECLEKAAREILTALADAREDAYNYRGMA